MNGKNNALRRFRTAAGLTQAQIAEAAGVNIRQVQKIESGESAIENITLGTASRLAAVLGCQVEDFLSG